MKINYTSRYIVGTYEKIPLDRQGRVVKTSIFNHPTASDFKKDISTAETRVFDSKRLKIEEINNLLKSR